MASDSASPDSRGTNKSDTLPSSSASVDVDAASAKSVKDRASLSLRPHSISLDTYLGIGCLCSQLSSESSFSPGTWTETSWDTDIGIGTEGHRALQGLIKSLWVRVLGSSCIQNPSLEIWRVYVLPDDRARGIVDRSNKNLRRSLGSVLAHINTATSLWRGEFLVEDIADFQRWSTAEECSLFYMFNTLPSPDPDPSLLRDKWSKQVVDELLDSNTEQTVFGLQTLLYAYQKRAVASMIQREVAPQMQLDPRLEQRRSPAGPTYYLGARDVTFLAQPKYYDTPRGGILAETMGLGKTIICMATILTTKGQLPLIPPQYAQGVNIRPRIASLVEIAATTITRNPVIPWKQVLDRYAREKGEIMDECAKAIKQCEPCYEIPPRQIRSNRSSTTFGPPEKVLLSGATLIIVPRNLVQQWQSEFRRHVKADLLKILVLDSNNELVPATKTLIEYDIVLFSRPRFEFEFKDTYELYDSPLRKIHWLRIIVDEGHGFSSASSHAALAAEKYIRAERRWIVSGTPAKDLMGVEVEIMNDSEGQLTRSESLMLRKRFDRAHEESSGAIKALGSLATHFLKVQPWASSISTTGEPAAIWDEYIYRHEATKLRTYSSFSLCLRRTLESLVIKTRPEDVARDLTLPALTHTAIRLKPSLFDKFSANLFVNVFTANAVTSERSDMDYLFHKHSRPSLQRLIHNLRHSGFIWNGFKKEHVLQSLEITEKYLAKEDSQCTPLDRVALEKTAQAALLSVSNVVWRGLTTTQEVGVLVSEWPEGSENSWSFSDCADPMITSLAQVRHAQRFINSRLKEQDPLQNFSAVGESAMLDLLAKVQEDDSIAKTKEKQTQQPAEVDGGIFALKIGGEVADKRLSVAGVSNDKSPKKRKRKISTAKVDVGVSPDDFVGQELSDDTGLIVGPETSLGHAKVLGTSSAKCSYLIDQISTHYHNEKILVFYDGNNIAYYLSEALDMLGIKHLIYSNTLTGEQRSKWVVLFDTDPSERVLIMDIKQAAHGLNLSSASRVYFVNPVLRPNIEAQAIKRAHRIGQTKPVHVETLILQGTIEEAMHDRAASMTNGEHLKAKSLEEDEGMRAILQQARTLPVSEDELTGSNGMAMLKRPQQIFGRPGRAVAKRSSESASAYSRGARLQRGKKAKQDIVYMSPPPVSQITRSPTRSPLPSRPRQPAAAELNGTDLQLERPAHGVSGEGGTVPDQTGYVSIFGG